MFVILKEFCESFRNFIIETKETKTPKTQPHDNFKSKTTTTTEKRKKMEKRTIFKKKEVYLFIIENTLFGFIKVNIFLYVFVTVLFTNALAMRFSVFLYFLISIAMKDI